jgi:cytochrome c oxidase assembly factor CtaG
MSLRALMLDWSTDGTTGAVFLVLVVTIGGIYVAAARRGERRDRRRRRWPVRRTGLFLGGLGVLVVDLYSGIGTQADSHPSAHMVEHMVMWVIVAPLLAAGAPVRLAFFALDRTGRRRLARALHSRVVSVLTRPAVSVSVFSAALLITHLPGVYGLALTNDYAHEAEHALYLATALLVWVPLLGVDPFPNRAGPRGQFLCMVACMVPMLLVAVWLGTAGQVVYGHYLGELGLASALHDQHVAATIMWAAGLPAFLVPALSAIGIPREARGRGGRRRGAVSSQGAAT